MLPSEDGKSRPRRSLVPTEPVLVRIAGLPLAFAERLRREFEPKASLTAALNCQALVEALASSSPDLAAAIRAQDTALGSAPALAYARYALRMCQRTTPFGGFAAVGIGELADTTCLSIAPPQSAKRVVKLSSTVLQALARRAAGAASTILADNPDARLQLNSTAWRSRAGIRYLELVRSDKRTGYSASIVFPTDPISLLVQMVEEMPVSAQVLCSRLEELYECDVADAQSLIVHLIEDGLLVLADLQYSTFDDEMRLCPVIDFDVERWLTLVDALSEDATANTSLYDELVGEIGKSFPDIAGRDRLDVTHVLPEPIISISNRFLARLGREIDEVMPLLIDVHDERLDALARSIDRKYGSRPVRLLEVLDAEQGFGFGHDPEAIDSMIPDIPARKSTDTPALSKVDRRLLSLVLDSWNKGGAAIRLGTDDIKEFGTVTIEPHRIGVLGSILGDPIANGKFDLRSVSFGNGTGFLGRFSRHDSRVAHALSRFRRSSEATADGFRSVDVVHAPAGRPADVVSGPIGGLPYVDVLGGMKHDDPDCTPVRDLFVMVRGGRLVLLDAAGTVVRPYLSHVHMGDWSGSVPVYRFFSALQNSVHGGRRQIWGHLPLVCRWLPRLEYKNVLLSRERWQLTSEEGKSASIALSLGQRHILVSGARPRELKKLRVVERDRFVKLDLAFRLDREILIRELRRSSNLIVEADDDDGACAVTQAGERFAHEVALTLGRPGMLRETKSPTYTIHGPYVRMPGSEWLFYKIFSDESSLEAVMADLSSLVQDASMAQAVTKWFFLRFEEEAGRHFRFRLQCASIADAHRIGVDISMFLNEAYRSGRIDHFDMSTYMPETDRYGGERSLNVSERVFFADSIFAASVFPSWGSIPRWKIALLSIWRMALSMSLNEGELSLLIEQAATGYAEEYDLHGTRAAPVDRRYREQRAEIWAVLTGKDPHLAVFMGAIEKRDRDLIPLFEEIGRSCRGDLGPVLSSHLHMCANRMLRRDGRLEEAILMIYVAKFVRSEMARKDAGTRNGTAAYRAPNEENGAT